MWGIHFSSFKNRGELHFILIRATINVFITCHSNRWFLMPKTANV